MVTDTGQHDADQRDQGLRELAEGLDALRVDLALGLRGEPAEAEAEREADTAAAADPLTPFLRQLRQTPRLGAAAERRLARRAAAALRLLRRLVLRTPLGAKRLRDPAAATVERVAARLARLARRAARAQAIGRSRRAEAVARALGVDPDRLGVLAAEIEALLEARQRALAELATGHIRLVVFLARRLAGRGLPVADLIQEGSLALLRAAAGYDWRRGVRFGTYAAPFIRQAMVRAINEQATVLPLPVHLAEEALPRIARARRRLEAVLGREPRADELARLARLRQDRVEQLLDALRQPVSLEKPIGEEGEETVGDRLAEPEGRTPFDIVAARERSALLEQALAALPPREAAVVRLRYGLGDEEPLTLEEVGSRLGVTRERARQIERRGLGRLRARLDHSSRTGD